jgi:hypothetical protein
MLGVVFATFSLRRELPDMVLGDEPLLSQGGGGVLCPTYTPPPPPPPPALTLFPVTTMPIFAQKRVFPFSMRHP